MFGGSESDDIWEVMTKLSRIETIKQRSKQRPQLIYKHSHRCGTCMFTKGNLEQAAEGLLDNVDMHFINVVKNREVSNRVASEFEIRHESPQAILIDNGKVIWHASHGSIDLAEMREMVI